MQTVGKRYNLWIMHPLEGEIDAYTMEEISESAAPTDLTLDAKIERWLGGTLSDAESALSTVLPDGWHVRIESP